MKLVGGESRVFIIKIDRKNFTLMKKLFTLLITGKDIQCIMY